MMNLNLKKLFATLGIATLTLAANVATIPVDSLAVSEYTVTAYADDIKETHFSIDAANGETFVNVGKLTYTVDDAYTCMVSVDNGKTWAGYGMPQSDTITKKTTLQVKCVKYSRNEKTMAKRLAKAKVYTYKFNVINTGVSVHMWGGEETVVDGMNVYADFAGITLGYPGKGINYGELGNVGFYKAKGKLLDANTMKAVKATTKKYDKKYAKLATQTLYYTLDGSTPTTKSKKVAAGKLKTIKVTNPGLNTLKVMGAKEKKVYTYTFYVDKATITTTDVNEAYVVCNGRHITPHNISVVGYKYFETSVYTDAYKHGVEHTKQVAIGIEPGESVEIPYNYCEDRVLRYGFVQAYNN